MINLGENRTGFSKNLRFSIIGIDPPLILNDWKWTNGFLL
jgi:hypothetical protein